MTRFMLATMFLIGCGAAPEASPFDADENDDSIESSSGFDGKGDTAAPVCATKPGSTYALGGRILTPAKPITGYVVIADHKISAIVTTRAEVPAGIPVIETQAIISPGFIDLHNHVAYNFIPVWNSGRKWNNRYQWAGSVAYGRAVKTPYNAVKNANHLCEAAKFGEFRAMVGGTTAIQGSVDLTCTRSWVRNVEFKNFCEDRVRQNVLPIGDITATEAASLNAQFTSGATRAYLVHLAEGVDDASRGEFETLRALDLLKPHVVGIHSTALTDAQLQEMGRIGMKVVWSPLSNMMLYGKTTNIPVALKANVKIALAPDWSPSGDANVLGELKAAARVNREQWGNAIPAKTLWQMATSNPADIIGMGDKLGRIQVGYQADLVVIRGDRRSPYNGIIDADASDVLMTVIDGEMLYGQTDWLDTLGQAGKYQTVDGCGEPRGIRTTDDDPKIPGAQQTLADLDAVFAAAGVANRIPLMQCDGPPDWAFPPPVTPNTPTPIAPVSPTDPGAAGAAL
jgi:5-methylthioadenosine/S-adenosylhomocysteine deaminase